MNMVLAYATMKPEPTDDILSWQRLSSQEIYAYRWQNTPENNLGVVGSYQKLYEKSSGDIICYVHDDCAVYEHDWDVRVLKEFEDPEVAIVGAGGSLQHGTSDLYKKPYVLQNLRRISYLSNVTDAEVHGERFTGVTDVAVLDGFFLAIRRSFLDRIYGWKVLIDNNIGFIAYDYVICALAHRHRYRIRLVGLHTYHRGGGTSVQIKVDRQEEYDLSHRWFYETFSDVMPWKVRS